MEAQWNSLNEIRQAASGEPASEDLVISQSLDKEVAIEHKKPSGRCIEL